MNDRWEKLWAIATGDVAGDATLRVTASINKVELVWPDGSVAGLYWHNDDWHFHEALDTCPRDVRARDAF